MTLFFVTPENLDFAKMVLRSAWRMVGSGHRTEVFARSLGYHSYSALLADMNGTPSIERLCRLDGQIAQLRLEQFGYNEVGLAELVALARSPKLPDRIFAEFKEGDLVGNNRWFAECKLRDIPMIYVQPRRKYVRLDWDCITMDTRHDCRTRGPDSRDLLERLFGRFQALARAQSGKAIFHGGAFVGSIDGLLPEIAHRIGDEYFEMLTGHTANQVAS